MMLRSEREAGLRAQRSVPWPDVNTRGADSGGEHQCRTPFCVWLTVFFSRQSPPCTRLGSHVTVVTVGGCQPEAGVLSLLPTPLDPRHPEGSPCSLSVGYVLSRSGGPCLPAGGGTPCLNTVIRSVHTWTRRPADGAHGSSLQPN